MIRENDLTGIDNREVAMAAAEIALVEKGTLLAEPVK
jgi:hypothetical protein